jgi:hypothetical protein
MALDGEAELEQCRLIRDKVWNVLKMTRKNNELPFVRTFADEVGFKNSVKQNQKKGHQGGGMSAATEIENLLVSMLCRTLPKDFKSKIDVKNPKQDSDFYVLVQNELVAMSFKFMGYSKNTSLALNWSKNPEQTRFFESIACIWSTKIPAKSGMWKGINQGFYFLPLFVLKKEISYFKSNNKSNTVFPNDKLASAMRIALKEDLFIPLVYSHSAGEEYTYDPWLSNPVRKSLLEDVSPSF